MPGVLVAELAVFILIVTIASTHCAYPWRDGQAELAWVAGYITRWFTCPRRLSPFSLTNRAQSRATSLIGSNHYTMLPQKYDCCIRCCVVLVNIDTWRLDVLFFLRVRGVAWR